MCAGKKDAFEPVIRAVCAFVECLDVAMQCHAVVSRCISCASLTAFHTGDCHIVVWKPS